MSNSTDFTHYLSNDALENISVSIKGKSNKDVDQHAFMMYDGTVITIERPASPVKKETYIDNPKCIIISCRCLIKIRFIDDEDKERTVNFTVRSMEELYSKWAQYKKAKEFDEKLVGTIIDINLTEEQKDLIIDLEDCTNLLLNILLDQDIQLREADLEDSSAMSSRYRLINMIINTVSRNLLGMGIVDKVHVPHMRRNIIGDCVELREYMEPESFM